MANPRSALTRPGILIAVILFCGLLMCVLTEWHAHQANGSFGFPLDDPWIHLQFAKNLHDFGSFSYYKNEMVTSGSTSPLYTFLLAAGFFVTSNEMVLSYVLGVGFFVLGGYYLFKLSLKILDGSLLFASVATLLFFIEPRLQWVTLSGMETTLFILLLLASAYYYVERRGLPLGICAGLLLWTRPEGILFLAVILFDAWYNARVIHAHQPKRKSAPAITDSLRWMRPSWLIFLAFGLLYAGFNLILSGSLVPNTYAAKIKYYSSGMTDFPKDVFHFITQKHLSLLSVFIGFGILSVLYKLVKRQEQKALVMLLWPLVLFLAYWKNLPYLYQEGRYMMPMLPFVILLGLHGIQSALKAAAQRTSIVRQERRAFAVSAVLLFLVFAQFAAAAWDNRRIYAEYCKYIMERQVRTAHWLGENLPADVVVATHDIGAIAFYSGRRVVDMVGLVSPEMVENIGSFEKLRQFLIARKATHLAVLRNWFEVGNQTPLFQTDERHPEIMEVFEFDPGGTHFIPQNVGQMTAFAANSLMAGRPQQAAPVLQQALRIDPQYSKAHLYLARALLAMGRLDIARTEIALALQLHPSSLEAQITQAELVARENRLDEAVSSLEKIIQLHPTYAPGYDALAQLYQTFHLDSVKGMGYLQRYRELAGGMAE